MILWNLTINDERRVTKLAKKSKKEEGVNLESVLWDCRVALRGVGMTEKNRDAVISLVFLKICRR